MFTLLDITFLNADTSNLQGSASLQCTNSNSQSLVQGACASLARRPFWTKKGQQNIQEFLVSFLRIRCFYLFFLEVFL